MMEIESRFVQAIKAKCEPFESTKSSSNGRFVEQLRAAQAAEPVDSTLQKLPSYILLNNSSMFSSAGTLFPLSTVLALFHQQHRPVLLNLK